MITAGEHYNRFMRAPHPELLQFLAPYRKPVRDLALAVRQMLLEEAPSAIETIYDAYNAVALGYSFTGRLKDGFCHLAVYPGHVNLGFNRGADLLVRAGFLWCRSTHAPSRYHENCMPKQNGGHSRRVPAVC